MSNANAPDPNSSLDELGDRLERGREKAGLAPPKRNAAEEKAKSDGLRAGTDFIVMTLVGAGAGWGIGKLFEAQAIGLVIGLFVGFAAGLRSVYRLMTPTPAETQKDDGDDGRSTD